MSKNEKNDLTMVRWSIKWKLMAIITVHLVGLVAILSYIQISTQKEMLEDELNKRITLMKENLKERGKSLIVNLSQQVENDIAGFNFNYPRSKRKPCFRYNNCRPSVPILRNIPCNNIISVKQFSDFI